MKNNLKTIVLLVSLSMVTSCDRLYDSVISFADMDAEELLKDVIDDDFLEICSNQAYTNALKITKVECSDSINSRKEICLNIVKEKWGNKISKKSEVEELTTEYVECLMIIKD